MERRLVVKSIGVGLTLSAGCISSATPGTSNQNPTEKRVSVAGVAAVPSETGVEFSIAVERAEITAQAPARLKTVMTNVGESEVSIQLPYYKGASSWAGAPGLLLYSFSAPDSPSPNYSPECFTRPELGEQTGELAWTTEETPTQTLAPGETYTDQLIVVDDWTAQGCFPVGTYRFKSQHTIRGEHFTWGFTLQVSELDR
ncbi:MULTISPECIES: hypothetical protein [unclassified Haladaptatus]|uniref:hypothetical protein n=1 Tax=unclassified Haladaptatus TaxID=2622732 RepID=UPI0023E7EFAC|nr:MULTISPECIES: hypothetical protein [unclassified Haladaptatus]